MNPQVEFNLGLILFLPWFAILGTLFWLFPRQPRNLWRRLFDLASLALSTVAFVASLHWAMRYADPAQGRMWGQILATSVGYGVFLAALLVAVVVRALLWRRSRATAQG